MPASIIQISGKKVIVVDCSNMNALQASQIESTLQEAHTQVVKQGLKSAYIITNITKTGFNNNIKEAFQNFSTKNTPYVKESVIVGVEGLNKIIYLGIKALTGRNFVLADTMEEAKNIIASK
jgi:hypothetical protein